MDGQCRSLHNTKFTECSIACNSGILERELDLTMVGGLFRVTEKHLTRASLHVGVRFPFFDADAANQGQKHNKLLATYQTTCLPVIERVDILLHRYHGVHPRKCTKLRFSQ